MSKTISAKLDDDQVDYLKEKVESGRAPNISEAVRQEIRNESRTLLQEFARRIADATALTAVFWVGITFWSPVFYRLLAIPFFVIAITCYVTERALNRYEPGVSQRLRGLIHGDSA